MRRSSGKRVGGIWLCIRNKPSRVDARGERRCTWAGREKVQEGGARATLFCVRAKKQPASLCVIFLVGRQAE